VVRLGRAAGSPVAPWLIRSGHRRNLSAIGLYLAAVLLSLVSPALSLALFWAVPLGFILLQSRDDRRAPGRPGAGGPP
jgi:hypothetical protein